MLVCIGVDVGGVCYWVDVYGGYLFGGYEYFVVEGGGCFVFGGLGGY